MFRLQAGEPPLAECVVGRGGRGVSEKSKLSLYGGICKRLGVGADILTLSFVSIVVCICVCLFFVLFGGERMERRERSLQRNG